MAEVRQSESLTKVRRAAANGQRGSERPPEKSYERPETRPAPPPYPVSRLVVRRRAARA